MNTHDPHDDDSLPGEDDLKAWYGSLPRNEPSPSLDQAVHRMAADAVRPAKRRARWPAVAASVAVLVLAGGISWRLHEPSPGRTPMPAPRVANDNAPATPAPKTEPMVTEARALAESTMAAPRPHETIRAALKPRVLAAAPAARQAAPAPQDQVMEASAPIAAPAPPPPAAAQAYAPAPLAEEARGNEDTRQVTAAKMMAAPASRMALSPDPTAPNPADSPEQELAKIRQLFAQQRRDEALQRLSTFQQAHPDIPVPDDLQHQQAHHE